MPSCVALGCSSRSDRGELFRVFPRKDLKRRQVWVDRVNRPGWNPTKFSVLCEHHFDRDQWEVPREDGKRKLKSTAVPTVFCVAYPSSADVVAADHSYCIVGYKKLYDNKYSDAVEVKSHEESFIPIEHIKVEVDENQNFTPEDDEETETDDDSEIELGDQFSNNHFTKYQSPCNEWKSMDTKREEEDAESIQCTPDIFLYPQQPDVDPIERVDWQDDDSEYCLSEPVSDPLAITPQDVVENLGGTVPHFGNAKKFLFVTKDTKFLPQTESPVAEGDLRVVRPRLRVLSPQRLEALAPVAPVASVAPTVTSTRVAPTVTSTRVAPAMTAAPVAPVAPIVTSAPVAPAVTPALVAPAVTPAPVAPVQPHVPGHKQLTLAVKDTVKISTPLKLKVISGSGYNSKMNMVTKTLGGNGFLKSCKDRPAVKIIPTIKVDAKPNEVISNKMPSQKVEIRVSPENRNKIVTLSYPKVQPPTTINKEKLIVIKNNNQQQLKNKLGLDFHRFVSRHGVIRIRKPTSPVEKVILDHGYTNKQSWRPESEDKEKMGSVTRETVPIVTREKLPIGAREKLPIGTREKLPIVTGEKLLKLLGNNKFKMLLKRYKPSVTLENDKVKADAFRQKNNTLNTTDRRVVFKTAKLNNVAKLYKNAKINIYQCSACKSFYSSMDSLKIHVSKAHRIMSDWRATQTADNECDKKVEEKLDLLRKEEVKIEEVEEDCVKKELAPRSFENNIVSIPDLNALKPIINTIKRDELVKMSNIRNCSNKSVENETIKTINILPNSESINESEDDSAQTETKERTGSEINGSADNNATCSKSLRTRIKLKKTEECCVYYLRNKNKLVKSKPTQIWKNKPSKSVKHSAILKQNPVVLVAKMNLKDIKNMAKIRSPKKSNVIAKEESLTHKKDKIKCQKDQQSKKTNEDIMVKCTECQTMIKKSKLKNHLMDHARSGFSCSICFKKFPKSYLLRRHITSDHNAGKFKCLVKSCAKLFESKRLLEKHTWSHKKNK